VTPCLHHLAGPSAERLVPLDHRGTYLGVIDRLPDIVASGATAVVLSNVFLSSLTAAPPHDPDEEEGASVAWPSTGGQLRRPLSFMAPEVALVAGPDPAAAASQLKAVVAALHGAGLEVLLEVRGHTRKRGGAHAESRV
jgi:glycogen operon protein